NPAAAQLAQDLMRSTPSEKSQVTLVASPLSTVSEVIAKEIQQGLNVGFIDISSVKVKPVLEVSALDLDMSYFLPSHPMAGREVGGAESARADLFQGRPWIIDSRGVRAELLEVGREIIEICGAHLIDMPAAEHDRAVALVSHLPQIMSSALAATLEGAPAQWLDLAGTGLRDTTRIAGSNPVLWREILVANQEALTPLLDYVIETLKNLRLSLSSQSAVDEFMKSGNRGRSMIPGKHGGVARNYTFLPVVIEDKPGQLAALFDECANAQVNVEDLTIEHSPEQYTGLITLALSQDDAEKLYRHLIAQGWSAHSPR
ncbi:MAG: prephenate dehydrogenase/arogenate dehydrogenase family protein, partial [Candidatus Planktophila sp.]